MRFRHLFLLFATLTIAACAASVRPLDGSAPPDGGGPRDAIADVSAAPDLVVAASCDTATPLGALQWRTPVASDNYLVGPLAADAVGNTYFVDDPSLLGVTTGAASVVSLDPCGAVRWRVPWSHFENCSVGVHAMVVGAQLIVADGDVQALDLATGRHAWTLDLVAFAAGAGLGDVSGGDSIRALVADGTGMVYVLLQSPGNVAIVRVDPAGMAVRLVHLPGASEDASAGDLVLDAVGYLDFPLTDTNVAPGPGVIYSFTRVGTMRFATHLPEVNYQDHLTVGADFVMSGDTGTLLALDGSVMRQLDTPFAGPGATDGAHNLFTVVRRSGDDAGMVRYDAMGTQQWFDELTGGYAFSYEGGPLLGRRRAYSVYYALDGVGESQVLQAVDLVTGAGTTYVFPGTSWGHALLTATGLVVFALDRDVVAVSTGGDALSPDAVWPTPHGGPDQRGAARGM